VPAIQADEGLHERELRTLAALSTLGVDG